MQLANNHIKIYQTKEIERQLKTPQKDTSPQFIKLGTMQCTATCNITVITVSAVFCYKQKPSDYIKITCMQLSKYSMKNNCTLKSYNKNYRLQHFHTPLNILHMTQQFEMHRDTQAINVFFLLSALKQEKSNTIFTSMIHKN